MNDRKPTHWSFLDSSVERSFAWSLALTILPHVSALAVSLVIARWRGSAVWGTVSWAVALATAVLIIGKLGLDLGTSRLASDYGVNRPGRLRPLLRVAFTLRAALTVVVAAATFALAPVLASAFHDGALLWPIRIAAAIVVCASFYEFQEQFLIGLNRHASVSRVRSLMLGLRVLLTIAVIAAGWGAAAVLSGYVLAWVVGIVVFAALLHRYLPPATDGESTSVLRRRLLSISVPLAVSSASVTIYSQMDKLMLGYFDSVDEVGQYSIARAVTEVTLFPAFAFVMTLRPALASRFASGRLEECAGLIRRSLRLSLVSGILFASVFSVMAVPLLTVVYGNEFRYAGELMAVFVWVIAMRSLGVLVLPALVAAERTRTYAYLTTFSAVVNFVLNLLLIPSLHARGAVLATVVSYALLLVLGLYQVLRVFRVRLGVHALSVAFRTVLAGALSGAILWVILDRTPDPGWGVFGWVVLQASAYAGLLVTLRVVRPADVRAMVNNLLKTNN
jgi:O-antigen/teichoic acid export membrane protein